QVVSATPETTAGDVREDSTRTAHRFGASFVVTGTVRRTNDDTVITAQLVDAGTGVLLWSDRFQERIKDPVELEHTIAQQLSASLGGMTGIMRRSYEQIAWQKPEQDLSEYDYYVRGHTFHHSFKKAEVMRAKEI